MSFTDEILIKYRRERQSPVPPRVSMVYKRARQSEKQEKPDLRRLSGELFRMTKPKLLSEGARIAADIKAAHTRVVSDNFRKLKLITVEAEQSRRDGQARFAGYLEREKKLLLEYSHTRRELATASAALRLYREGERGAEPVAAGFSQDSSKLEVLIERKLIEAGEGFIAEMRRTARGEAEAAVRRWRDDEEYDRLRGR